ncbi:hypothetical protein BDN71DRAFT_1514520 [Pleurotus eryngii]|uniref:Uncharacterized protein n=1 Tax=Pleurotus eryngii TaxID=5323 RepID=A0A9P5ZHS9_PLEER|nr:hypothetical protein BDN71DRAFT_1514520 [Pleurotus eryngii]
MTRTGPSNMPRQATHRTNITSNFAEFEHANDGIKVNIRIAYFLLCTAPPETRTRSASHMSFQPPCAGGLLFGKRNRGLVGRSTFTGESVILTLLPPLDTLQLSSLGNFKPFRRRFSITRMLVVRVSTRVPRQQLCPSLTRKLVPTYCLVPINLVVVPPCPPHSPRLLAYLPDSTLDAVGSYIMATSPLSAHGTRPTAACTSAPLDAPISPHTTAYISILYTPHCR